jgi:N-acetylglucosaminylphosphatidylinositol deacetylase
LIEIKGDYEGMGEVRKKEFVEACNILGIPRNRCLISSFPDHPDIDWDDREVAKKIQIAIEDEWKCEMRNIFTFDQYGVSGHLNHRCAARGVR